MAGLRNLCKAFGGMTISDGSSTINYVWDYATDEAVDEKDMPMGSERWKISERAKWAEIAKQRP